MSRRKRARATKSNDGGPAIAPPQAGAKPAGASRDLGIATGLVVAVLAVYLQCAAHPFLRLDDPDFIVDNPHINSGLTAENVISAFTTVYASNWHPLTAISHLIDIQLFGLDGSKHILVNIAIHAAASVLLFFVLHRATHRRWPSAIAAALFAIHPLHVESVAWASERKDVLSAFFFFLMLWFWLDWIETQSLTRYWLAVAAFVASLLSKPMMVTAPFLLLVLDWWPFERKIDRRTILEKWPFLTLAIASSIITMRTQTAAIGSSPLSSRIANSVLSYVAYLAKAFWPANLSVIYPYRTNVPAFEFIAATTLLLAITAAAFALRRRFPFLLAGWLWFLGTLVPVIGIVQIGHQAMADRYTYIPLIGIFIAVVWTCAALIHDRIVLTAASAILLLTLSACTYRQIGYWRDGVALFEHAIAVVGSNRYAHEGLARELLHDGQYQRAAEEFRAAVRDAPDDDALHTGLGSAMMQLGDPAAARSEFEAAVAANPRNAEALRRLGDIRLAEGRTDDAVHLYERSAAVVRDPSTLAVLAAARGNVDEAVSFYRQAIGAHPEKPEIRNDLAAVLSRSGREPEALAEYETALRLDPHQYETRMNLGAVLTRLNRPEDAMQQFALAAQERPESPEPHVYIALTLARMRRFADAVREANVALQINPEAANMQFTSALRLPARDANLTDWIAYLRAQK